MVTVMPVQTLNIRAVGQSAKLLCGNAGEAAEELPHHQHYYYELRVLKEYWRITTKEYLAHALFVP